MWLAYLLWTCCGWGLESPGLAAQVCPEGPLSEQVDKAEEAKINRCSIPDEKKVTCLGKTHKKFHTSGIEMRGENGEKREWNGNEKDSL